MIYLLLIESNLPLLPMLGPKFGFKYTVLVKREVIGERQFVLKLAKQ